MKIDLNDDLKNAKITIRSWGRFPSVFAHVLDQLMRYVTALALGI